MSSIVIVEQEETPAAATCPLCCEATIDVCLSTCSHESCVACMVKWVKKAEASGHQEHPTCPYCRKEISQDETAALLGRPFQPAKEANVHDSSLLDDEVDDLTLHWLREQTKPCPHCGALIEKEEGCDLMECLCGYRFCYGCGSPGAQCSCTPDTHVFYDNVIHRNAGRAAQAQVEAPTNDETGLVDLQAHIERRLEQQRREDIQRERKNRRNREEQERMEVDEMTLSAKWLFYGTSREHSLRILQQQMQMQTVRRNRKKNRQRLQREQSISVHPVLSSGSFLFRMNDSGIERVLRQLVRGSDVKDSRIRKCMKQRREIRDAEEVLSLDAVLSSGAYLFRVHDSGIERVLRQLGRGSDVKHSRTRNQERQSQEILLAEEGIDAVLAYGKWLFRKQGRDETLKRFARLMEQQQESQKRRRSRGLSFSFFDLFGCGQPGCPNCGGFGVREDTDARENVINIRLLFLNDEKKTSEQAEIERDGL